MTKIHSTAAELPASCKSAAERTAEILHEEDRYATLSEDNCKKLTHLEQQLSKETGEKIALVAYRL